MIQEITCTQLEENDDVTQPKCLSIIADWNAADAVYEREQFVEATLRFVAAAASDPDADIAVRLRALRLFCALEPPALMTFALLAAFPHLPANSFTDDWVSDPEGQHAYELYCEITGDTLISGARVKKISEDLIALESIELVMLLADAATGRQTAEQGMMAPILVSTLSQSEVANRIALALEQFAARQNAAAGGDQSNEHESDDTDTKEEA